MRGFRVDNRAEVSRVAVGPVKGPEALSRSRSTATDESSQHCRAAPRRDRIRGLVLGGGGVVLEYL